jgi:hypothetical protein
MSIASRTPEGSPNRCPVCAASVVIEPSQPPGDAPCPACGHLLWFPPASRLPRPIYERIEANKPAEMQFNAAAWRNGGIRLRGSQCPDLIQSGVLIGLTPEQVDVLLGLPDEEGEGWLGYAVDRGVRVTYRGTPHRLRVQFRPEGVVREAFVLEK